MYLVSLDPADPYPKFVKTRSGKEGEIPSPSLPSLSIAFTSKTSLGPSSHQSPCKDEALAC